jgi:phage portal protein BeeE
VTSLLGALVRRNRPELVEPERSITTIDDYISVLNEVSFMYGGHSYSLNNTPGVAETWGHERIEEIPSDLEGFARAAYGASGVVYACLAARMSIFSQARFQWQQLRNGKPSTLFGTAGLSILEEPWVGGTTQDFLAAALLDADLCGNSYWVRDTETGAGRPELIRLRPDWVRLILEPRSVNGGHVGYRRIGFAYWEGGKESGVDPVAFLPADVLHFMPRPDPLARYRGISWLQTVVGEIQADKLMAKHKQKFFSNAATPNLSVSLDKEVRRDQFEKFVEVMQLSHAGVDNAYKTLYLGGGADVRVIGADFKQMDFSTVQGHGETRISAAAGIPPILVGLSEGLKSSTFSNYGQARRHFADLTMFTLWQNMAGSASRVVPPPPNPSGVRLWFDTRDIPFLREDKIHAADIQNKQAATINALIMSGFIPESAVAAVSAEDWSLLEHTGLISVQLLPPVPPGPDGAPVSAQPPAEKNGKKDGGAAKKDDKGDDEEED